MKLRNALPEEVDALNHFVRSSKAVWGYSKRFLDKYIAEWGLTRESIEKQSIKVLEENGEIHGVFRIGKKKRGVELNLFFVNPKHIKTGVGRKMWGFVDEYARAHKWKGFDLVVDPNSEAFFHRMGAKTVKTQEFAVVMKYELLPTMRNNLLQS